MGWNRVHHGGGLRLFDGVPDGAYFYFVHSYYPDLVAETASPAHGAGGPDDVRGGSARPRADSLKIAWCEYGLPFAAAIERDAIHATQFHPEKSQRWGLRLLENFAALVKERAR